MTVTLIRGLIQRADTSAQAAKPNQTTSAVAPESQAASSARTSAAITQLQSGLSSDAAVVRLSGRAAPGGERIRDYERAYRETDRVADSVLRKPEEAEESHGLGSDVAKSHLPL